MKVETKRTKDGNSSYAILKSDEQEFPKVEVEWIDAQAGFSTPLETKELIEQEPIHTFSTGYLICQDKEKVILGFMKWDIDMWKHWQLIPKGMIKKITKFKEVKDE